jgi:hypothetical protein
MAEFASDAGKRVKASIYDKSVMRVRAPVAQSAFSFIFSEMVQYFQLQSQSVTDLERKLEETGYGIGQRMSELIACRERHTKREVRLVSFLHFVKDVVWKHLFNKAADGDIERSMDNEDEYMIYENTPITNAFVSVPDDMGSFTCAAFIAGILSGVMDSASFNAKVTAHSLSEDRTVFLVKFSAEVMEREQQRTA